MSRDPRSPDAPAVLGLGLAGAAVCAAIALAGNGSRKAVQDTPLILPWLFLVVVQGTLYGVLPPILLYQMRDLWSALRRHRTGAVVVALCVLIFVAAVPLATRTLLDLDPPDLPYLPIKWIVLNVLAVFLTALPAAVGMYGVQCAAREVAGEPDDTIHRYLDLRSRAGFFLTVMGAMVALGTLTAGAARQAFFDEVLPPQILVAYGGHFTLVVALVYAPVHLELKRLGRRLLEGMPESAPERADVELGVRTNLRSALETSVPVFAPLLSGLLTLVIH